MCSMPQNFRFSGKTSRGMALLTVVLLVGFLLGLSALTYYTVNSLLRVQGAVYQSTLSYQSGESALRITLSRDTIRRLLGVPDTSHVSVNFPNGSRGDARIYHLMNLPILGGSMLFAMGYESIGLGPSRGGIAGIFQSQAQGRTQVARTGLEALYLYIVGLP